MRLLFTALIITILITFSSANYASNNIYNFLLAEIAIYRDNPEIAISNLKQLLVNNNDPNIAKIITEYAIELEHFELSAMAAKQWALLEPTNWKAQLVTATTLLEQDPLLVEEYLYKAIQTNPKEIDSHISNLLTKLLEPHQQLILQLLQNLADKNPNNFTLQLCLAQVAAQLNQIELATIANNRALKLKPDLTHAIFLQAKLIRHNQQDDTGAIKYLKQKLKLFNNNDELRLFYINVLLDNNTYPEALANLKILLTSKQENYKLEAYLLLAEIHLQEPNLNLVKAKNYLNKLINKNFATNKVAFLLGQIAEQQNDINTAVNWYTTVDEEPYHIISYIKAATLLVNDNPKEALAILQLAQPSNLLETKQLLLFKIELALYIKDLNLAFNIANTAVEILPNDIDFLYVRSVVAGLNNQLTIAEQDLKQILSYEPDNHSALNALGYLLTTQPERNKEALGYLEQAIKLSPNNPIYLDSLGWLLYNMGNTKEALEVLNIAYKIDDAPIIASHLGEVLWNNGQKKQATTIWQKAWKTYPDDIELLDTLKQYKVNFAK